MWGRMCDAQNGETHPDPENWTRGGEAKDNTPRAEAKGKGIFAARGRSKTHNERQKTDIFSLLMSWLMPGKSNEAV